MKCIMPEQRQSFTHLPPNKAKAKGRNVKLRHDWNKIRLDIMYDIIKAKFTQNNELKRKLLATDNAVLIEGNTWNDTFWGVNTKGKGQNNLGKILMRVRNELK